MLRPTIATVICALFASVPAAAHITLKVPTVRYSNSPSEQNKSCPCGAGAGNRLCTNGVTSDPNRARDRVTTYTAGETVTLFWDETVGHGGRYRVAFDADGADLADFNDHILLDIADPAGGSGNLGTGNGWAVSVTLPNTPCDNCTLQLLQVMNGNTVDRVPDPTNKSTYFQCADIRIVAGGEGEGEGEGESENGGEGEGENGGEGEGENGGEGEGENGGEGEGEGPSTTTPATCAAAPTPLLAFLALTLRRRRRATASACSTTGKSA